MTDTTDSEPDPTQARLEEKWPDWTFWWSRPDHGRQPTLYATRRRHLTLAEHAKGLAATLPFGHRGDLAQQLEDQAALEKRRD